MIKNRKQAEEKISAFFENPNNKKAEEIRKIKRLAMHYHIRLGDKRKLFCKYCYSPKMKIRKITKDNKTVECINCGKLISFKIS